MQSAETIAAPEPPELLPAGRYVELPRRGTTFVREVEGPPGAPTLLLLHGWVASGALNWFRTFQPLGQHFRVLAPDLRGHARGLRSRAVFRLHDCADDAAAMLVELDAGPVVVAGYSMGGPVAQLLWKRHRDLVSGLVLCATAPRLLFGRRERIAFTTGMAALAGTTRVGSLALAIPGLATRARPLTPPRGQRGGTPAWAAAEMRRHDLRTLVEAGHSLGTYDSRGWIHDVDVPTTVLVTERDRGVPASAQLELAARIPGATAITVADGHTACAKQSFVEPFLAACRQTAARVRSDR